MPTYQLPISYDMLDEITRQNLAEIYRNTDSDVKNILQQSQLGDLPEYVQEDLDTLSAVRAAAMVLIDYISSAEQISALNLEDTKCSLHSV